MTRRVVWTVYRKEVLETLRDRRTLIVMLLLPLCLYPLMAVGTAQWLGVQQAAVDAARLRIGLVGPRWPSLMIALRHNKRLQVRPLKSEGGLRLGNVDAIVRVPRDYKRTLSEQGSVRLRVQHDQTRATSVAARRAVRAVLHQLRSELIAQRLDRWGLPPGFSEPLQLDEQSVATKAEVRTKMLSSVLPLLVVLMVLLGAFYPAIDLTAGEKERGTLETLLSTPVPRIAVIIGKFLVVATVALVTGAVNLGSIALTVGLGFGPALRQAGLLLEVPWVALLLTLVSLIPAALFFAAVLIAVASLARSFREGQNLLTPVYLACMVPAIFAQLPGMRLGYLTAVLPGFNVALMTRELISGQIATGPVLLALFCNCVYAALALALAARIYNTERLLFVDDWRSDRQSVPLRDQPEPAAVAMLLLLVMALIIVVGQPLQVRALIPGLLATEWLLVATPVLLYIRLGRFSSRRVLSLHRTSPRAMLGAALAGFSGWYLVAILVEGLQQRVLPIPPEVTETMRKLLFASQRPFLLDLLAIAVSPAICEELLFRGVLWRATRKTMRPGMAIAVNALAFGAFHLSIYRFLPTATLGAVLALIIWRTQSIYPAMFFHSINNGVAVVLARFIGEGDGQMRLRPLLLLAAAATFSLGLMLIWRAPAAGVRTRDVDT